MKPAAPEAPAPGDGGEGVSDAFVDDVLDTIESWLPQVDEEKAEKLRQAMQLIEECADGGDDAPAEGEEPAPEAAAGAQSGAAPDLAALLGQ